MHVVRRRTTLLTAFLFVLVGGFALSIAMRADDTSAKDQTPPEAPRPAFREIKAANDNPGLFIFTDPVKAVGWIADDKDYSGRIARITVEGQVHKVNVGTGNVFVWEHRFQREARAEFQIGPFRQIHTIYPGQAGNTTIYYIVDRTAYRPGQPMKFVGFMRRQTSAGEFVPVTDGQYNFQLTSVRKGTVVSRWKLRPDSHGRVTGEYRFSEADSLDEYRLACSSYTGEARVKLAEFRKAKVKLDIKGERRGRRLKLEFRGLDFLNKPVEGSSVRFTARVFRTFDNDGPRALNSSHFVYQAGLHSASIHFASDTSEDRLLADAGMLLQPAYSPSSTMVAELTGEVAMGKSGKAEYQLPLEAAWTRGQYSVQVNGVLTDYNGREQRATRILPISSKVTDCNLELQIDKRDFATGEPIKVSVKAINKDGSSAKIAATMLAMKLSPTTPSAPAYGYGYGRYGYSNFGYPFGYNSYGYGPYGGTIFNQPAFDLLGNGNSTRRDWQVTAQAERSQPRRTLVTASVVRNDSARVVLSEPGAYKLVCVAEMPNGEKLKNEVGCVVHKEHDLPSILLELDRKELRAGDVLSGTVHCRYANAMAFLTIRDAFGMKHWQLLKIPNGVRRFELKLPKQMTYGATVEVLSTSGKAKAIFDSEFIRVEPTDRSIDIKVKSKEVYAPGATVDLDIELDRKEEVDLVVSVYDESLIGIAKDKSKNVRDYYLADERIRHSMAAPLLHRLLGNLTVKELVESIEEKIKGKPVQQVRQWQQVINRYRTQNYLYVYDVRLLMEAAGVAAHFELYHGAWTFRFDRRKEKEAPSTLAEVLLKRHSGWQLLTSLRGNVLVVREVHPTVMRPRHLQVAGFGGMGFGYGMNQVGGNSTFSANAGFSFQGMPSGQSMISHMPIAAPTYVEIGSEFSGDTVRRDFSDAAYWNATLRTDAQGKAKVRFRVPDSLTNWRVVVTAVSKKTHVGQKISRFRTSRPVMVWPILPRGFTEGDQVRVYATVHNRSEEDQMMDVALEVKNGSILSPQKVKVRVPAKSHVPVYWTFRPEKKGFTQLLMSAECGAGSDASLKRLPVAAMEVEQAITQSGFARDGGSITVPKSVDMTESTLELTLVPSLLDDTLQSLDYLVQYPYGCVEQTMSRFLPALVVKQTLDRAGIEHPGLEKKLPWVMEKGIKRLLELQRPDGGWGWQGGSQTHEMMTPYAMYGLLLAQKAGYTIPNQSALSRGEYRLRQFINAMGDKQPADRVYCMYVYSLRRKLDDKQWKFVEQQLSKSSLSDYALALCLEMAVKAKKSELADQLARALRRRAVVTPDGAFWRTANFSRWGNDRFEITAAALKALVAYDSDDRLISKILSFFAQTKRGKRWNSTKDTAMIIYAICDYLATRDLDRSTGNRMVEVRINDGPIHQVMMKEGLAPKVVIDGQELKKGDNTITFRGQGGDMMYRAVFLFRQRKLAIKPLAHGVSVSRKYYLLDGSGKAVRELKSGEPVARGSYIESVVEVENQSETSMQYVLVENPRPSSCEVLPENDRRFRRTSTAFALREDRIPGIAYHHERTGKTITDRCVLHAELSGEFLVPPARVELMYRTLTRGHSTPFQLIVQ